MSVSKHSWQHWDHDQCHQAYDNIGAVPEASAITTLWRQRSDSLAQTWPHQENFIFGSHERQRAQLFYPQGPYQGILVFIHGGYWQYRAKEDFYFLAQRYLEQNWAVAFLGYPLAPEVPLKEIVASVDRGLAALYQKYHLSFHEWVVCGWSAGAHLAVMASEFPWVTQRLLISGIYDLLPLEKTGFYQALGLSSQDKKALSPRLSKCSLKTKTTFWVGAEELPELIRQSEDYVASCVPTATLQIIEKCHHFSILNYLAQYPFY